MSLTLQDFVFTGKVIPSEPGYESRWTQWKVRATPQLMPLKGSPIPMSPKDLQVTADGTFSYPPNATLSGDLSILGVKIELIDGEGNPIKSILSINGKPFSGNAVRMTDFAGQTMELLAQVSRLESGPDSSNNTENQENQNMSGTTETIVPIKDAPVLVTFKPRTMKGRAIDKAGEPVKNTGVIVYVQIPSEGTKERMHKPFVFAKTDAVGNFSVSVTTETFLSAFATLGIAPDRHIEVVLSGGQLPEFTLLVLDETQAALVHDHDGCACEDKPGRLPEMEDLLSPESIYQQDIGGSCVNFTTPNRALEEFAFTTVVRNTDPDIMNAPGYLANLDKRITTLTKAIADAKKIKPSTGTDFTKLNAALLDLKYSITQYPLWPAFKSKLDQIYKDSGATYASEENNYLSAAAAGQSTYAMAVNNLMVFRQSMAAADRFNNRFGTVTPTNDENLVDIPWMESELRNLQAERAALPINGSEDLKRKSVSRLNQIQWDSPLPLVQPASISHGHILHFRQVWRADGYSMGDLLYSLPLAPGQKKQIVIHDWERRETAARTEEDSYQESLSNALSQDRDINEIVNSTLHEQTEGHSKAKVRGATVGGGLAISAAADMPVEPNVNVSAKVGYSGGFNAANSKSESWAEQKSSRDISANSMQHIREKTTQNATAMRSQRSTVVTSMSQHETTTVRSEFVANYNHCHAITIQYFEVLRHLAVHTELVDVQECLFIPLTMSFFDDAKVVRWSDILRYSLRAPRSKYTRLARGFDALRRYYDVNALGKSADDVYYNVPDGRLCDEQIEEINGTFRLRMHFACPKKSLKPLDENHMKGITPFIGVGGATAVGIGSATITASPEGEGRISQIVRELLIDQDADAAVWRSQLGFVKEIEDIRHKVNRATDDKREAVFQAEMAKVNAAGQFARYLKLRIMDRTLHDLDAHITLTRSSDLKRDQANAEVSTYDFGFRSTGSSVQRDEIQRFGLKNTWRNLPEGSVVILDRIQARYESQYLQAQLLSASPSDDITSQPNESVMHTPMQDFERVSPRKEDLQLRSELLDHLNTNMEYYHKAIWVQMDADRRMMLLEGFDIEMPVLNPAYTPGGTQPQYITPSPRVSVASVVENRLVGIVGNSLIMPVAKGFNLNPAFQFANDLVEVDGKQVSRLLAHYMPEKGFKETPFRISLPTKGVFAEAVMGACNSCEKIDNSRFWKWEEHPIPDSPTAIEPVSTESRRAEPANLSPTAWAEAMLKLQEGKNLPDPTGLAKALELLGKNDLFKDITGLEGNQQNAIEALKTNVEAAKHYADLAAKLAMSQEVAKNGDAFADSVKKNVTDPKKQQEIIEEYYGSKSGGDKGAGTDDGGGGGVQPSGLEQAAIDAVRGAAGANTGKTKVTLPDGTSVETEHEGAAIGEAGQVEEIENSSWEHAIIDDGITLPYFPEDPNLVNTDDENLA